MERSGTSPEAAGPGFIISRGGHMGGGSGIVPKGAVPH